MPSILPQSYLPAILVLADGTVFHGQAIGAEGFAVGEVVFNTAMTGYQEILTDPSYCRQMVTLTYPHIGNTGVNVEDNEAAKVYATGLIIKDLPRLYSNFRANEPLTAFLKRHNVVAIAGIDTRKLTRLLRTHGSQNGCISVLPQGQKMTQAFIDQALVHAKACPSMGGCDLAQEVSCKQNYTWNETVWKIATGYGKQAMPQFHVVAYDFGVKRNILRMLAERSCRLTVVAATTPASEVFKLNPDGVFFSNGPGDPEPCRYAVAAASDIIEARIPTFGICLGHQIMALACGARTFKMKFGHHGANHPVKDLDTGRVCITSQNHGFAVNEKFLPETLRITHSSLFDGTLQGMARVDKPAFSFQGHPEAAPGPNDIGYLFDRFTALMSRRSI